MWQAEFYPCGWSSGWQVIRWTKKGRVWAMCNHLGFPVHAKFQDKQTAETFAEMLNNGLTPDEARAKLIGE